MARPRKGWVIGLAAALTVLSACGGDDGPLSPTAPSPLPPPQPAAAASVAYLGTATGSDGERYTRPWQVRITGDAIELVVDWGSRREYFSGRMQDRSFTSVAYPPVLDEASEVVEERLSGVFSSDLATCEATMTAIVGRPEVDRRDTQWSLVRR